MGLFDLEVNCLTKILFGALVVVSLVMVALQHFAGRWYLQIFRFLLLFSHIVPIRCVRPPSPTPSSGAVRDPLVVFFPHSLRVNLDMGKMVFSWMIKKDSKIPGTVVRASTIPEQLGRISYLLTDKTGSYVVQKPRNFGQEAEIGGHRGFCCWKPAALWILKS